MKHGFLIALYISEHSAEIKGIDLNGSPNNGYLKFELFNGQEKVFDKWDEEDQGLFGAIMNKQSWNPSMRGIPASLSVSTNATSLNLKIDKPVINIIVNDKPLQEWGTPKKTACGATFTKKESPKVEPEEEKKYCGFKSGFLG